MGVPVLAIGCGCLGMFLLFGAMVGIGAYALNNPDSSTGQSVANTGNGSGTTTPVSGANGNGKEFILTHYTPCTPDAPKPCDAAMEGGQYFSHGGKAVWDTSSPMGYYAKYNGKRYDYQFASSQHSNTIFKPFTSKSPNGVYFDDQNKIFITLDHYGSCMTAPNGMDILASNEKYSVFFNNLKKAKMIVGTANNGCGQATRVKGTLVDIIKAGTTGVAPK